MPDCQVRPYTEADRDDLRAMMLALQIAERVMEPNRAQWSDAGASYIEEALAAVAAKKGAIFIAESHPLPDPVGFVTCWQAYEDDSIVAATERDYLYVADLYVADVARGRGIAGALLDEAEGHGRTLGLDQVRIGLLSANQSARRAYQKAGFEDFEVTLRKRL